MSTEELLRPRYKLIARYPGCGYEVGDIIIEVNSTLSKYVKQGDDRNFQYIQNPEEYTANFQLLQWWEDLTPEQVPKYIKSKDRKDVREVIELTPEGFKAKYPERPKGYRICYNERWLPATLADYEAYMNQKESQ